MICFFYRLAFSEQQRSQDAPTAAPHPRASDSGTDTNHTPPSNADNGPQPPSSKPGWAEEGGSGWGSQGAPATYQVGQTVTAKSCPVASYFSYEKLYPNVQPWEVYFSNRDISVGKDVLVLSVCQCRLLWWTMANRVCLYTGAQVWIGWSQGAALPPTWAAPWKRALLLLPTGRHPDRAS